MKRTIRRGVFETNSSSVHSLTMCSDEEWQKWKSGELVFDDWKGVLVPQGELENNDNKFNFPDDFFDHYGDDYDLFNETYTTPNGEVVHAFGYYGHD